VPPDPLGALVGAPVTLSLRGGNTLRGVLVTLYKYEMVVRLGDGKDAIVMKHAVDWIEPADGATDQASRTRE
jgi:sRNA-binding regulator protein Hfq